MKYYGSLLPVLVFVVALVFSPPKASAFCTPQIMSTSTTKRPTASSILTNLYEQEKGTLDVRAMMDIKEELDIQPNQDEDGEPSISLWTARALLMLIAILWGTNFGAVKYLETLCFHPPCVHPPSEAAFARFGLAALVSVPLLIGQRKDIILAGLECGLWITLGYITQALALSTITAGKCAFICSLTVVVVPLISAAFYGKPLKSMHLIAGAVALAGVGILEGLVDFNDLMRIPPALADHGTSLTSTAAVVTHPIATAGPGILGQIASALGVTQGDIIALGQPFGFGYTFIRIEHYMEKFKDVPNKVLTLSAAQCVAAGTMSLLWVLYDYEGTLPNFEYMVRLSLLLVGGMYLDTILD
jgi:drug/metabolite transporter (DMT)-like permease